MKARALHAAAAAWVVVALGAALAGLPGWLVLAQVIAIVLPAAAAVALHRLGADRARARTAPGMTRTDPAEAQSRRYPGVVPVFTPPPAAAMQPAAPARAAPPPPLAEPTQQSLLPDPAPAIPPSPAEIALALDFAQSECDGLAQAAIARCAADPDLARLIRAAQDAIAMMGAHGLYVADVEPRAGQAALWRCFAAGGRGADFAPLAPDGAAEVFALAALRLREDEVLRDAVHHFLRRFDATLGRIAPEADDATLEAMVAGSSGRAFGLMARAVGTFG
ncbi:MAG: hypothetical protein FJX19_04965 [Alphaproteobacteria bacterium]|nr:hypothetical protein [Alphaproteobacteria bacterium]